MIDSWKKGFDAWENVTAQYLDAWLRSPLVLWPSGAALTGAMRAKKARQEVFTGWWRWLGLATREDQERTLHALHQLESRLLDLEEHLEETRVLSDKH
jgi:hypothetical protein